MHSYTREREDKMCRISPDDDHYLEELLEAVKGFRSFGQAMEAFLVSRGYQGDPFSRDEKAAYVAAKFRQSGITAPRNIKKWFQEPDGGLSGGNVKIGRNTAFQICFAFQLNQEETEDFFRRIYRTRGFDLHNIRELIYCFGLSNGLSYGEVSQMIEQAGEAEAEAAQGNSEPENAENSNNAENANAIRYTASLAEEAKRIADKEEFMTFIREHREDFKYSNTTAYHYIHILWGKIADEDGIAAREKRKLYRPFNAEEKGDGGRHIAEREAAKGAPVKQHKHKAGSGSDSLWEIYLQMLGLAGTNTKKLDADRSLKSVLKDNELLHSMAEDCFPDRDGLNKMLNGRAVSYERIRKMMILLVFYSFWAGRALQNGDYYAKYEDAERCFSQLNAFLTDTGYPTLYAGNPYDWIFMYALMDDCPLVTFRDYIQELSFWKEFRKVY